MSFDLRPHQETAIAKMHNGCILCGGVGVGKSHTAVGYYLENEAPRNVYVITTAKKRDKHDWQFLFGDVGMTGNPEATMGALVIVDSWENIKKYEEVKDAFFIFDEQRLVGSGRWVKAFYKIAAANRWIMLSATPGDNWLDYVPVFRANGFIKNLTQFKEDHVLSRWTGRYYQVTGYRQVAKLVAWRNQLLVDMPYEKHTTRHTHEVVVEYDKDLVKELVTKRWHVYEDRPLTDASELFRVMRKVVYSDASRLEAIRHLIQTHPKLIVFYNFDYELEILRTLGDTSGTQILESEKNSDSTSTTMSKTVDAKNNPNDSTELTGPEKPKSRSKGSTRPASVPSTLGTRSTFGPKSRSSTESYIDSNLESSTTETGTHPTESTSSSTPHSRSTSLRSSVEMESDSDNSLSLTTTEKPSTNEFERTGSESWEYLLSPEGMRANSVLMPRTGPIRSSEKSSQFEKTMRDSKSNSLSTKPECDTCNNQSVDTSGPMTETSEFSGPTAFIADSTDLSRTGPSDTQELPKTLPNGVDSEHSESLGKHWEKMTNSQASQTPSTEQISAPGSSDKWSRHSPKQSETWEKATGIPTDHPNAPYGSTRKTSKTSSISEHSASGSGDGPISCLTRDTDSNEPGNTTCSHHQERTDQCVEASENPESDQTAETLRTNPHSRSGLSKGQEKSLEESSSICQTESPDHPPLILSCPSSTAASTNSSTKGRSSSRILDSTKKQTTCCSESPDTQDFASEERTEAWQNDLTATKSSSTATTKDSKSAKSHSTGSSTEKPTSRSTTSPRTSSTRTSSQHSKRSSDPSTDGSGSTSSQSFQVAEWNGHKHEDVPTTTSWVYLVQYVAGAEAWECIETDAMVFYSPPYSYKTWWQAHGRIDRLNTPFTDLHYYILFGGSVIEKAVRASLKAKKSFNESAFASKLNLF